jgi:sec-independent protein translocase protein TatA
MPNIGPLEIAIVLIIVLIIFGPKRLPELGQSMGRGIREFRSSLSGDKGDKGKDDDSAEEPRKLEASQSGEGKPSGGQSAESVEGEIVTENKA